MIAYLEGKDTNVEVPDDIGQNELKDIQDNFHSYISPPNSPGIKEETSNTGIPGENNSQPVDKSVDKSVDNVPGGTISEPEKPEQPKWTQNFYESHLKPIVDQAKLFGKDLTEAFAAPEGAAQSLAEQAVQTPAGRVFGGKALEEGTFGLAKPLVEPLIAGEEKDHPVAAGAGSMMGGVGSLLATGGALEEAGLGVKAAELGQAATKLIPEGEMGAKIAASAVNWIPKSIMSGATFGTQTFVSKTIKMFQDGNVDLPTFGRDVLRPTAISTTAGGALGVIGRVTNIPASVASAAGLGFVSAKMDGADNKEAGLSAAIWAAFEFVGSHAKTEELVQDTVKSTGDSVGDYVASKDPSMDPDTARRVGRAFVDAEIQKHGGLEEMGKKEVALQTLEDINQKIRQGKVQTPIPTVEPQAQIETAAPTEPLTPEQPPAGGPLEPIATEPLARADQQGREIKGVISDLVKGGLKNIPDAIKNVKDILFPEKVSTEEIQKQLESLGPEITKLPIEEIPKDLQDLYHFQQHQIEKEGLTGQMGDVSKQMDSLGLAPEEKKAVLDQYGLSKSDVFGQNLVGKNRQGLVNEPIENQVKAIASALATQRQLDPSDPDVVSQARDIVQTMQSTFNPPKEIKVDKQGIPIRKPEEVVSTVETPQGRQVKITHQMIMDEAKGLLDQATEERNVLDPVVDFVRNNGGIRGFKGGMEAEEFKDVPVHVRGQIAADEMAQMAYDRNLIEEPDADLLRNHLASLPAKGPEPRIGEFYDEAQRNLENHFASEGPIANREMIKKEQGREAANKILVANKIDDQTVVNLVDSIVADNQAFKVGYGQEFNAETHVIRGETKTSIENQRLQTVINLANGATDLTGRHEAFHAVSNLLLNDAENRILNEAFGSHEKAADAFAKYQQGINPGKGFVERIFDKIKQFLERLKNYFKEKKFATANDIFEAIDKGEMGERVGESTKGSSYSAVTAATDLEDKAIEKFGLTKDVEKAGFVLNDGRMLDFTHGGKDRIYMHQDVASVFQGTGIVDDDYSLLQKFLGETQAVRLSQYTDLGTRHISIESHGPLSSEQLQQIGEYYDTHPMDVSTFEVTNDLGKAIRHKSVANPTSEDIARFFNGSSQYSMEEKMPVFFSQVQKVIDEKMQGQPLYAADPVKSISEHLSDSAEEIKTIVNPTSAAPLAAQITREQLGIMARNYDRAEASLEDAKKLFDKQSKEETTDFIDKMEKGEKQLTPALENIAKQLRVLLDTKRQEIRALGTGKLDSFIENYFPHIWDQGEKQVSQAVMKAAKRPFEGSKSFLKKRTIESFKEGIEAGLTPVSFNPVDLVLLKMREMDKYLTAHRTLNAYKENGLAQFTRIGQQAPEGWIKIDDRISTVMRPIKNEAGEMQGLAISGHYYAQPDAARIINNYLSPGLQKSAVYRAFRYAGNAINQFQLGFSAFHLGFTSVDAIVSKGALANYMLMKGHLIEAIKARLAQPFAPITNIIRGDKLLKAWRGQGQSPADEILAQTMASGGGRARMDQFYATKAFEQMKKFFQAGKPIRGILSIPLTVTEASSKPILEYIVPRQKLGVFADIMNFELKINPNMTHEEMRAIAQRAWDSVDNRMGQLVYDNLFWNRTHKDLAMASVRSVGWNLGTIREIGGGAIDTAQMINDLSKGKKSEFTYKMSYVIELVLATGIMGAMYQYLRTGKGPEELKDYYFPKTGGLDANGNPNRVSLPSYMKDIYHYGEAPLQTVVNKMSPVIAMIVQMWQNKDYYGVRIRNEDDPVIKQMLQEVEYIGKQLEPFGFRNMQKQQESGNRSLADVIQPWIGITPAPWDINQTKAEKLAHEIAMRHIPIGGRTQEQADRSTLLRQIENKFRMQDPTANDELMKAFNDGKISARQMKDVITNSRMTPLQRQVQHFSYDEIKAVYDKANPDEKQQLERMMERKEASSRRGFVQQESQ